MEIRPQTPKNGIFQKNEIFLKRPPDFASNEPSTTPDIKFKSSYARNMTLAYYAQMWKFGPRLPKMEFFTNFSFF